MTYQVKLQQFEGPLPLLLELIEKQKLDITTVSLAQVADDFLEYLEKGESIDLGNLSDFLLVASQLILIKSKALLPFFEFTKEEEEDIDNLEKRLKEYRRFKEVAKKLGVDWLKQNISFSKEKTKVDIIVERMPDITGDDLFKLAQDVVQRNKKENEIVEEALEKTISLEEKIVDLKNTILNRAKINFQEVIKNKKNKVEVVVSFLAVLEMLKQRFIIVEQKKKFGDIIIRKMK